MFICVCLCVCMYFRLLSSWGTDSFRVSSNSEACVSEFEDGFSVVHFFHISKIYCLELYSLWIHVLRKHIFKIFLRIWSIWFRFSRKSEINCSCVVIWLVNSCMGPRVTFHYGFLVILKQRLSTTGKFFSAAFPRLTL